jgi:hypothetical protein
MQRLPDTDPRYAVLTVVYEMRVILLNDPVCVLSAQQSESSKNAV